MSRQGWIRTNDLRFPFEEVSLNYASLSSFVCLVKTSQVKATEWQFPMFGGNLGIEPEVTRYSAHRHKLPHLDSNQEPDG